MVGYTPRFAPFQPSNLRFPTGPSSPASPLSPPPLTCRSPSSPILTETNEDPSRSSPAPPPPRPWLWCCHKCHEHYRLGATSRCLNDGHTICFHPMERVNKRTGKRKQRQPCSTEFDYGGWKLWNEWRRRNFPGRPTKNKRRTRDCCRKCDYPSQCTDPNDSTPSTPGVGPLSPRIVDYPTSSPASSGPCTTFEQILGLPAPETPPTSPARVSNHVSATFDRLIKAAEIGRAQLATLFSPNQEEFHAIQPKPMTPSTVHETTTCPVAVLRPCTSPTRSDSDSKQTGHEAAATTKVASPAGVEDFPSFKARMDRIHGSSGGDQQPNPARDTPSIVADDMMPPPLRIINPPQQRSSRRRTPPPSEVEYLALSSVESAFDLGYHHGSLGGKTGQEANEGGIDMAVSVLKPKGKKNKKASSRGRK